MKNTTIALLFTMKNMAIALLLTVVLVLSSFLYRQSHSNVFLHFPIEELTEKNDSDPIFFLLFFFSRHSCPPCLEIIQVLNNLPSQFKVIGIVPENEMKEINEIREQTSATFKIIDMKKFVKVMPLYTPALLGVSKDGKILFSLPAVPGAKEYFTEFLETFYTQAFLFMIDENETE